MNYKVNLFIENNGVTESVSNRKPYLNAIPIDKFKEIFEPPTKQSAGEFYFGVGEGRFFPIFKVHTSIPMDGKFYYPIIWVTNNMAEYAHLFEIPDEILSQIKKRNCKILLISSSEGWKWEAHDNLIDRLNKKFNLNYDNFVVMSANMTTHHKYKTVYFNHWEVCERHRNTAKDKRLGHESIFNKESRRYKFICLNKRSTYHRFGIVAKLFPYKENGLLSFWQNGYEPGLRLYQEQLEYFKYQCPRLYKEWQNLNIEESLPLLLPPGLEPYDGTDFNTNPTTDDYPDKFYNSYLHIVSETYSDQSGFFSEKMFKPVLYFQPFVLIGPCGALENFKKLGYKTFSGVIDESYDSEPNLELRIQKASDAIFEFINRPDIDDVMKKIYPILGHNYSVLENRFKQIFEDLPADLIKALE